MTKYCARFFQIAYTKSTATVNDLDGWAFIITKLNWRGIISTGVFN